MDLAKIWQEIELDHEQTVKIKVGNVEVWVYKVSNEFHIAYKYFKRALASCSIAYHEEKPTDLEWKIWVQSDDQQQHLDAR